MAQQDVQAAINAAGSYLPKDLPNPPVYSKVNPADAPILTLAMTSDTLELSKVEDLADTLLAQKISQLSGVGLVSINGRAEAGGAHPGEPDGDGELRAESRGHAVGAGDGERRPGEGQPERDAAGVHDRGERPAALKQRLQTR